MAFMSQDGWKSGLTPVQLTKVEALQTGFERMQKEAAQKKLMVENQEQELERQKRKLEGEKSQGTSLQREIQGLQENVVDLQKKTERLQHDLGSKDSQNMWLQGQLETKGKHIDDMSARLKKAEKNVEELENASIPMSAPAFCTPQKSNRPKSSSGSIGSQDGDVVQSLRKQLDEAQRLLGQKDGEVKDLENKMFEQKAAKSSLMSFDDTPVGKGSANSDPFDETPLPSMARSSSLKFGDIASRSKSSSIAFDYQSTPPGKQQQNVFARPTPQATPVKTSGSGHQPPPTNDRGSSKVETANVELKMEIKALQDKCADLEQRLSIAKSAAGGTGSGNAAELELSRRDLEAAEAKIKAARTESDCQKHNLEAARAQLEKKLKERESELQADLKMAVEESASLQRSLAENEAAASKKEKEAREEARKKETEAKEAALKAVGEKSALEKELSDVRESRKTETEKLTASLGELKVSMQKQETDMEVLKKDKTGLEREVSEMNKLRMAKEEELKALKVVEQRAKNEVRDADKKMNTMMAEWKKNEKKKEDEINREKDKVFDLTSKVEEMNAVKAERAELQTKVNKLSGEMAEQEVNTKKAVAKKEEECAQIRSKVEEQSALMAKLKEEAKDQADIVQKAKDDSQAMDGLKCELEKAKSEAEVARSGAENAKAVISEHEKKVENLVGQISELEMNSKSTIDQKNDECTQMRSKFEEQSELVAMLREEAKDLTAANDKRKEDSDAMNGMISELEKAKSDAEAARSEVEKARATISDHEKKMNDLNVQITELEMNNKNVIDKKDEECSQVRSKFEEKSDLVAKLEEETKNLILALKKAKEDSNTMNDQLDKLEKAKSDAEVERSEAERAKATIAEREKRISNLNEDMAELEMRSQQTVDKKNEECSKLKSQFEEQSALMDKLKEEAECQAAAVEKAKEAFASEEGLKSELEKVKSDLEEANKRLIEEKETHEMALENKFEEISSLQRMNDKLDEDHRVSRIATDNLEKINSDINTYVKDLKQKYEEVEVARSEAEKSRTAEREEERQKLAKALGGLRSERLETLEKEDEYESMLEMSSAIITTLQEEVAKEKAAMEEAQAANEELRERFDDMTSHLNNAVYSLTMLKVEGVQGEEDKMKLLQKVGDLENEKNSLGAAKCQLDQKLAASEKTVTALNSEVVRERAWIREVAAKTKTFEEKVEDMTTRLNDAQYGSLMAKVQSVDAEDLAAEVSALKAANADLEDRLREASEMYGRLRSDYTQSLEKLSVDEKVLTELTAKNCALTAEAESGLKKQLETTQSLERAVAEAVEREAERETLGAKLAAMEMDLSEAKYDLVMKSVSQIEAEGVTREFDVLKRSNLDMRRNLDAASVRCKQLQDENASLRDNAAAGLSDLRRQVAEANEKLEEAEQTHEMALENKFEEISSLQHLNDKIAEDFGVSKAVTEKLEKMNSDINKNVMELKQTNDALQKYAAEAKESRDMSEEQLKNSFEELEKVRTELQTLTDKSSATEKQEMNIELKEVHDENSALKKEIDEKESELIQLGEKIQDAFCDLEEANKRLKEEQETHEMALENKFEEISSLQQEQETHEMALENKFEEISMLQHMNDKLTEDHRLSKAATENLEKINSDINTYAKELKQKYEEVEKSLAEANESRKLSEMQLKNSVDELQVLRSEVEELEGFGATLRETEAAYIDQKDTLDTIMSEHESLSKENDELTEDNRVAKAAVEELEKINFDIKASVTELKQRNEVLEKNVAKAEESRSLFEGQLKDKLEEIQKVRSELQTHTEESTAKFATMKQEMEEKLQEAQNENASFNKENFEAAIKAKESKLEEVSSQLADVKSAYEDQKDTMDTIMSEHEGLTKDNDGLTDDNRVAKAAIKKLEKINSDIQDSIKELKQTNETLEKDAAQAKESRDWSEEQLKSSFEELQKVRSELQTLTKESSTNHAAIKQEMDKKMKDACDENSSLIKEINDKESELIDFGEKIQDALADLEEANAKTDEINKSMMAAKNRVADLEKKIEERDSEISESEKKISGMEANMEEAKMTSEGFAQENAALEDKLSRATKESKEKIEKLEAEVKKNSENLDKYSKLEKDFAALNKSKDSFKSKTQMLLLSLKQKEKELTTLAQDVDKLTAENQGLKSDNDLVPKKLEKDLEDARNALKKYEGGCGDPMPWETDEDLLDLKPLEILDCVADELTFAQRAKLHELCIEEMKDELKGKTQKYIELLDEFNAAKKELDRANLKLKCERATSGTVSAPTKVTATKARATSQQPKATAVATTPKPPVAATRPLKNDENLGAAKKRLLSPEKGAFLADKRTRVHSPKVSAPLGLRNARNAAVNSKQTTSTATTLQKDAPTNPFAAKKSGIVKPAKLTVTKPLESTVASPMDKGRPATRSNTSKRTLR